jgi:ABC-type maltose transport system permease subunit
MLVKILKYLLKHIVLIILFIIFIFAIYYKVEVSLSLEKGITVKPIINLSIKELESRLADSVPQADYNKILANYEKAKQEHAIDHDEISKIKRTLCVKEDCKESLSPVVFGLKSRVDALETNSEYSFKIICSKLEISGPISTKRPIIDNEELRTLYKHIQICLSAIGSYNGICDGEQLSTYSAVMEFQSKNKLIVDGVLGNNTWRVFKTVYEKKKVK